MWIKKSFTRLLCLLAPWVASSSIFWFSRGEWLAFLGALLTAAAMAALSIDYISREKIAEDLDTRVQEGKD